MIILSLWNKIMGFLQRFIPTLITERNIQESSSSSSSSTTLPDVAVDKIIANLTIADRVRLSCVSKSWRSALTRSITTSSTSEEDPWLIMSVEDNTSPEIPLKSLSENRTYRFKLPASESKQTSYWCCCGSCDGWLLIAFGRDLRNLDLILWNPLSGETKNLPPLSTLSFSDRLAACGGGMTVSNIVRCARVASRDDGCTIVAVVLSIPVAGGKEQLALCTTCDRAWRPVGSPKRYLFHRDICFRKGKLYAVMSSYAETKTRKHHVRFECGNACDVVVVLRDGVAPLLARGVELLRPSGVCSWERYCAIDHLVECSITGDLLAVTAVMDLFSYRASSSSTTAAANFCCTQTRRFEVYRLSLSDDDDSCISFLDGGAVGEQGVFVGHMGTVSRRDGDRISFATKNSRLWTPNQQGRVDSGPIASESYFGVLEQGVYDVRRDGIEIQSTINVDFLSDSSSIGWFMPNLALSF